MKNWLFRSLTMPRGEAAPSNNSLALWRSTYQDQAWEKSRIKNNPPDLLNNIHLIKGPWKINKVLKIMESSLVNNRGKLEALKDRNKSYTNLCFLWNDQKVA